MFYFFTTTTMTTIGIDVSKKKLDVYNDSTQKFAQIKNEEETIREYLEQFMGQDVLVLYEATGCYSSCLIKVCNSLKLRHQQLHPLQFSLVRKGFGNKQKTDKADAKAIALLGSFLLQKMGTLTIPTPTNLKVLSSYLSTIDSLKKLQGRYSNLIEKTEHDSFCDHEILTFYEQHMKEIDKKIEELLTEAEEKLITLGYQKHLDNLRTIPSVGNTVSIYLLLFFLDLQSKGITKADRGKVVSYSGLNPNTEESGSSLARTKLSKQGRSSIRSVLYMPSMNRYKLIKDTKYANTNLGQFFQRMKTKFESPTSKRGNSVICAMMKKTLLVCRGVFQNNTAYNRS